MPKFQNPMALPVKRLTPFETKKAAALHFAGVDQDDLMDQFFEKHAQRRRAEEAEKLKTATPAEKEEYRKRYERRGWDTSHLDNT